MNPQTLTDRMAKVMELAGQIARYWGHHHIGAEHVLLAIAYDGQSVGAVVLKGLGISAEMIDVEAKKLLGGEIKPPTFGKPLLSATFREYVLSEEGQLWKEWLLRQQEGAMADPNWADGSVSLPASSENSTG